MRSKTLAFDLGRQLGFAVLGGREVLSGSHEIVKRWSPLGASLLKLEDRLYSLIKLHKPNAVAVARPFVRQGSGGRMIDTPQNLVPMYCGFGCLNMLCAAMGIHLEVVDENEARRQFVGEGNLPAKSEAIKAAIMWECRNRGWVCRDNHAGDAICVAAAAIEKMDPDKSYEMTPLFMAAPTVRARRKAKKAA